MLAVVGGGHFGSFHARQLLKAIRSGQLAGERLMVVDRDPFCAARRELEGAREVTFVTSEWRPFICEWLTQAVPGDRLVPAPLAPHLLGDWLAEELGAERVPPPGGWDLPFEKPGNEGTLYLSAAAWWCPAACVEPAHCPVLHAPRDWDLAEIIERRSVGVGV